MLFKVKRMRKKFDYYVYYKTLNILLCVIH